MSLEQEDCAERIRLVEIYSRAAADLVHSLALLRGGLGGRRQEDWRDAATIRAESQKAWLAVEQHIATHQCLDLHWPSASHVLERAAEAALDIILVADDHRRFVDVNEAASKALELPRNEIVGRRIDEFFTMTRGETVAQAWDTFVSESVQCGTCELDRGGHRRKFEYRAKANFAPGLHLSVLREVFDPA